MPKINNLKISKVLLKPSANEHNILYNQFIWRTEKKFIGENVIAIMDNQEAVWWNRPAESAVFCKLEEDGLYSYNLPYAGSTNQLFKTQYNLLLNKHSVPIAIHIKLDDTWTEEDKLLLQKMCQTCIYDTLLDLGVAKEDLSIPKNDLLFKGRKFMGAEYASEGLVYSEDLVVTLKVQPEQEIFQRLTGQYALKRPITGISEEVPSVTKEAFIERLIERLNLYIEDHFN
jgi:hypothetical protein